MSALKARSAARVLAVPFASLLWLIVCALLGSRRETVPRLARDGGSDTLEVGTRVEAVSSPEPSAVQPTPSILGGSRDHDEPPNEASTLEEPYLVLEEWLSGTFIELVMQLNQISGQGILVSDCADLSDSKTMRVVTIYARGLSMDSAVALLCAAYGFTSWRTGDGSFVIQ